MRIFILFLSLGIVGCSASTRISHNQTKISDLANEVKVLLVEKPVKWEPHSIEKLDIIVNSAQESQQLLTHVEDKIPWWATLIGSIIFFLSLLGVCFLLWYLGIGVLVKKILYSFGLLIPASSVKEASLLRKTMDDSDPATIREYTAAKRAVDPAFDAAYKKLTKEV